MSPQTLSRILHAVHASPSFDTIVRLAHAVNENVGWIPGEPGFPISAIERRELGAIVEFLQNGLLAGTSRKWRPAISMTLRAIPMIERAIPMTLRVIPMIERAIRITLISIGVPPTA